MRTVRVVGKSFDQGWTSWMWILLDYEPLVGGVVSDRKLKSPHITVGASQPSSNRNPGTSGVSLRKRTRKSSVVKRTQPQRRGIEGQQVGRP